MFRFRRSLDTYALWTALAAPLAFLFFHYWNGDIYYGEFVHDTGRVAVWLLFWTLAITPLRLLFPGPGWSRWLLIHRRYFGVAVLAYALAHALAYLVQTQTLARWLEDGSGFEMWTGWLALAVFLPLAVTSNDWAVRKLRGAWKPLHRLVHLSAVLVLVHWIFTAFDPFLAYVHLALLGAIEGIRLLLPFFSRRKRAA